MAHHMAGLDADCQHWAQLGLSTRASVCGLSLWLRLLIARWLESNSKCCKRQEVEAASLLRSEPRREHNTISVKIYWSSSPELHRFKRREADLLLEPLLNGLRIRNLWSSLTYHRHPTEADFVFISTNAST